MAIMATMVTTTTTMVTTATITVTTGVVTTVTATTATADAIGTYGGTATAVRWEPTVSIAIATVIGTTCSATIAQQPVWWLKTFAGSSVSAA